MFRNVKGWSDAAIDELAARLVERMDAGDLYDVLHWSDAIGSQEERAKVRVALARHGFLERSLALFKNRATRPHDMYWLRVFLVFGEFLPERKLLFLCPGLMDEVIDALQHDDECWFDAVALLWGILEDPVQAARYAGLAEEFLKEPDDVAPDSEQAMGCIALLCRGAPMEVARLPLVVAALQKGVQHVGNVMTAFFAANAACHLFLGTREERFLEIVETYLQGPIARLLELAKGLQEAERKSEFRWIAIEWATDLLGDAQPAAALLGLVAMAHLLQNPTNGPLVSEEAWEHLVALQHHPDERIRAMWTLILPFLKTRPYQVPRLQTLAHLSMQWRNGS
jgi:hypothetical protein